MLDTGILWDMHGLTIYSGLFDYLKTHISASCTYVELYEQNVYQLIYAKQVY